MADLGDLLLKHNAIDLPQLEAARGQQRFRGGRIEHILVEQRMVPESKLVEAIANASGVRRITLDTIDPDGGALAKLKADACWEDAVFPCALRDDGRTLWVAVTDPTDITLLDKIIQRTGCRVKPLVAGIYEVRRAIRLHYYGEADAPGEEEMGLGDAGTSEFKITDMSGKTLMTSMDQLKKQHDAQVAAQAAASAAPAQAPAPEPDDLGDDLFAISAFSPEEKARLEKILAHQEKSSIVLRSVMELLHEKGVLAIDDIRRRSGG